ncbi:MAG: GIY-YIG nuclease family protein [Actinobacteria bacterium]|nr:GIY-YIG nuclease family protein [Actinomycetota bacterium]
MMAAVRSGRSRWQSWPLFVAVLVFSVLAGPVANPQWAYGYDGPSSIYDGLGTVASVDGPIGGSPVLSATVDADRYSGFIHDSSGYASATNGARGVRGLSGAGDELAQGGVYALRDPVTGQVVRTGRTSDLIRRAGEHLRDPALADYEFEIIARTDIYAQQRGLEQLIHEAYSPPLNLIRPINPTNPSVTTYLDAAAEFLSTYGGG